jgi:hypothetical protein
MKETNSNAQNVSFLFVSLSFCALFAGMKQIEK